jgi:hypothetical protein
MHSYQELKTEFINQKKLENNENVTINTEHITENENNGNIFNSKNKATNNSDIMLSLSAVTSTDINNKKKLKDFFKTIKAGGKQGIIIIDIINIVSFTTIKHVYKNMYIYRYVYVIIRIHIYVLIQLYTYL